MAHQTPRQRLQRPSFGTSISAEKTSLSASTAVNRKASLNALTGAHTPRTPAGNMHAEDLALGDAVNVPGEMYGTVRFIGNVKGKNGQFVGVELDREFAARGKNDGDVDGTYYFNTAVPGAGIFLPVHRAERRFSPAVSIDSFPATPATPSYSTLHGTRLRGDAAAHTPPTPAVPHRFAQSVGPGAQRPTSPNFKPKRPSLPRPESPLRRHQPTLAPTPARALSQSQRGGRPPLASTSTPSKTNLRASTTTRPTPSRPYSRTGSRLGQRQPHHDAVAEEETRTPNKRTTSSTSAPSFSQPLRSPSRASGANDTELSRLRQQLADRDRRLEEQAASLAEMEANVKELSTLLPTDGLTPGGSSRSGADDEHTVAQLRQMLREKNEKITLMTADFDAHRADFRSTLDSLEMASTETERVYEEQKRDLLSQLEELQAQNHALNEELAAGGGSGGSKDEFESVAQQLKGLEELVAELEDGLEESRRGEAEARGEVEFLRGEVERGRSELRRERDKGGKDEEVAKAAEVKAMEDEIRGLKAIIHSLSTNPAQPHAASANGGSGRDEDEVMRLQAKLEQSQSEKEELERELEGLRRDSAMTNGHASKHAGHARNESEMTAVAKGTDGEVRQRSGTLKPKPTMSFAEHARRSGFEQPLSTPDAEDDPDKDLHGNAQGGDAEAEAEAEADGVYCDICQSSGEHDTVDCGKLNGNGKANGHGHANGAAAERDEAAEAAPAAATTNGHVKSVPTVKEEDKWCALCEKDGHLAFDCPEEQY
ncbi:hypothetical protein BAUCODRAFT_534183 [Baudoinia panamericana UAMH 10762]|uniref:CAP-Gly domain-containing protein n=1 Tax=Baudoinia panamericana (strain UAMH 10762) TaxID=717646 RepID=M2MUM3_BAUPA|nr:uncharacterized protein BAUCODRAFT_534183 [Baudoinia panamericana UAMH 10762]EMC95273.1 hypothetical protein BAUCODRAFT_534183 [Baudoinia panamericana UAMH 10762]